MELLIGTKVISMSRSRIHFVHEVMDAVQQQLHLIATIDVNI